VKVIIPAACFNASQIDAASFVFKTIRTGFPTAEIVLVIGNTIPTLREAIVEAAVGAGINPTRNDDYADRLLVDVYAGFLRTEQKPFFYCDTDVFFWDSIENHLPEFEEASLAGRYIPKFFDRFTRCVTMPRLHSCLLYVNPLRVRREIEEHHRSLGPETPYTPRPDLFQPSFVSCKELLLRCAEHGLPRVAWNRCLQRVGQRMFRPPDLRKRGPSCRPGVRRRSGGDASRCHP
jgi:hypothetical protein